MSARLPIIGHPEIAFATATVTTDELDVLVVYLRLPLP